MKRLMIILFAIGMTTMSSTCMAGMSKSKVRKEARFLTDKMSYELGLSAGQQNDAYEINYDFIYSIRNLMDDVLSGEEWAMDRYYYLLDIRNDDLRWVLNSNQYRRFAQVDYFYRPIYASGNNWSFRIYFTYTNYNHFFFGKPYHYTFYHCDHYRYHYDRVSYYRNRYNHAVYVNTHNARNHEVHKSHRVSDFNSVKIRPNTSKPKESVNSVNTARRPNASRTNTSTSSSVRSNPEKKSNSTTTARPATTTSRTSRASSASSSSSVTRQESSSSRSSSKSSGSSSSSKSSSGGSAKSSSNRSSSSGSRR